MTAHPARHDSPRFINHSLHAFAAALAAMLLCLGGCAGEEQSTPEGSQQVATDGADASFGALDGKADSALSACQVQTMLSSLNSDFDTVERLKAKGVHTRAAKAILAYMHGDDATRGGNDDRVIADLAELDAIKYVGPAALRQLLSATDAADATCAPAPSVEAEVVFSPQPVQSTHLVKVAARIDEAERTLDIAMYSFSNSGIQRAIERAVDRGVRVRAILESGNKDRKSPRGTISARLEEMGVNVRYVNKIMHHKYVLIDGPRDVATHATSGTLISGSGNWSNSAGTRYDENTVFIKGSQELNLRFQREFNRLWEHSRDFVWQGDKPWELSELDITAADIEDQDDVHAVFTSANFRDYVSSRYGETFGRVRGRDEVSDFLVAQIEGATSSIRIASGHLRSRPVAEALIAKHQDAPSVDIKVYLDGQEYISSYWHTKQEGNLETCLVEAGSSDTKKEDCIDKGFYFGYALKEAGVDVRYKYYSYRWHYKTAAQMHHKYLIIDNDTVIQGSYNLSDNAEHNTMENMALFTGPTFEPLVQAYADNFDQMWVTGQSQGLYDDLVGEIEGATTRIPIVFDSMSLDWEQITALKSLIRTTCPAINSAELRENPEKHTTCPLN